jgi:hypothetical protein
MTPKIWRCDRGLTAGDAMAKSSAITAIDRGRAELLPPSML